MSGRSVLSEKAPTVLAEQGSTGSGLEGGSFKKANRRHGQVAMRQFTFYSKLLGCRVGGVKGAQKDKCRSLGELFGFWLQEYHGQFDKVSGPAIFAR